MHVHNAVMFRHVPAGAVLGRHTAPQRMYVIVLDGRVQFAASDGEARVLGAGQVLLVEDTVGKGHQSESFDGPAFRTAFVTVS